MHAKEVKLQLEVTKGWALMEVSSRIGEWQKNNAMNLIVWRRRWNYDLM
jgi:hypothetical protein